MCVSPPITIITAWLVELAGGAVADSDSTCFPKSQREAAFTIVALHQWELDDDDPFCISTAEDVSGYAMRDTLKLTTIRQWICETLKPVATGGPYPAVSDASTTLSHDVKSLLIWL